MGRVEAGRTVERVQLLEKLDMNLDITETQYRSDHSLSGEARAFVSPEQQAIRDRESPPRGIADAVAAVLAGGDDGRSGFPSTRFFIGLSHSPPLSQDEDAHRDDSYITEVDIDGVPENGTIEFDADWTAEEAQRALKEGETRVLKREYNIEGLPHDRQPVIIRANLYRDVVTLSEKLDFGRRSGDRFQQYEGLAGLVIEVELRDTTRGYDRLALDRFYVELSRTFPQIQYEPFDGATYDPEARRIEWSNARATVDSPARFVVVGPISQLIDVESVIARFRGKLSGNTVSGLAIEGAFDETGEEFTTEIDRGVEHTVTVGLDAEIDPSALIGEAQEVSRATISANTTPEALYAKVRDVCTGNGILIRESKDIGDAEPVVGRDGVFVVSEDDDNAGKMSIKKEYGDRGVVYAELIVTGRFTAISEESQVSAFDESEDRLVRADMGGLDTRGRSEVAIRARSAASELNSELISTFERELGGV
ncbi:MAG: hypothetical protein V5A62_08005 [Haloarculaceae archaeon]